MAVFSCYRPQLSWQAKLQHFLINGNQTQTEDNKKDLKDSLIRPDSGDAIQWTGVKAPLHLHVPDIGIVYEGHSRSLLYTPCEVPPDDQPLTSWQINSQ